jgi:hypothetical protein
MKMLVKVFCETGLPTTATAKLKLGSGVTTTVNRTAWAEAHANSTGAAASGAAARGGAAAAAAAALAAVAALLL